jgi:hypothetical protein
VASTLIQRLQAAVLATVWALLWGIPFVVCVTVALGTVVMNLMLEGGLMPPWLFWGVSVLVSGLVLWGWHGRVVSHLAGSTVLWGARLHAVSAAALIGILMGAGVSAAGLAPVYVAPLVALALAFAATFVPAPGPRPAGSGAPAGRSSGPLSIK